MAVTTFKQGRGLDVGTGLIISAQGTAKGLTYREFRNAYVCLPEDNRTMLEMTGTPFIEVEGQIFAVGDDAVDLAFNTHSEIHRPMAKGLLHPSDTKAKPVLAAIFEALLGEPVTKGEPVFFSIPADPEGAVGANLYHTKVIQEILLSMGYTPKAVVEGVAVCYAEAKDDKFTALTLSFGAGMTNLACVYRSLPVFTMSLSQGGDWIDFQSSIVAGVPVQDITVMKERGVLDLATGKPTVDDLTPQQLRELEGIYTHYEHLIRQVILAIKHYIESNPTRRVNIPELPVILSGGSAKAVNFLTLFKRIWEESNMPLKASVFRMADPIQHAVAKGVFYASQLIKV